jgi:hypothetical protein
MKTGNLYINFSEVAKEQRRFYSGVKGRANEDIRVNESEIIAKGTPIIIRPLSTSSKDGKLLFQITKYSYIYCEDFIEDARYDTVEIDEPTKAFVFDEHFQLSTEYLFPREDSPLLNEVMQGSIGSCGLLAAIQSILNHPNGKYFIRNMMRQHDDGTTTVRLFNPKTSRPEYVHINTAKIVKQDLTQMSRHKALWLDVLEAAVTSVEFPGRARNPSIAGFYGINANDAFYVIMGLREDHEKSIMGQREYRSDKFELLNLTTADSLQEDSDHLASVFKDISSWLFPGEVIKTATELYSRKQLDYFDSLKDAIDHGQLIAAGSAETLGFGYHAFTIIGVDSHDEHGFDPVTKKATSSKSYNVILRNPWNRRVKYGAEFTLSFSDFLLNFHRVSISHSVNRLFELESKRSKLIDSIEGVVEAFHVRPSITLEQLGKLKHQYDKYEHQIIELEELHLQEVVSNLSTAAEQKRIVEDDPDDDSIYNPSHHLFKLRWLKDPIARQALKAKIVAHAGYDFNQVMRQEKLKLDMMSYCFKNQCMQGITLFQEIFDSLEKQLDRLDQQIVYQPKFWESLFQKLSLLEAKCIQISTQAAWLTHLGVYIDASELVALNAKREKIQQLLKKRAEYKQFMDVHREEIDAMFVKASEIQSELVVSKEELADIRQIAKSIETDLLTGVDLEVLGKKFTQSDVAPANLSLLAKMIQIFYDLMNYCINYIRNLFPARDSASDRYNYFVPSPSAPTGGKGRFFNRPIPPHDATVPEGLDAKLFSTGPI